MGVMFRAAVEGLAGIIEQGLPNLFDAEEIGMVLGGDAEGLLGGRRKGEGVTRRRDKNGVDDGGFCI
jgi:hypothetical protein